MRENHKTKYTIMEQPLDRVCRLSQFLSFWIWTLVFILGTPAIILFSIGYTFDNASTLFLKKGAISLVTEPEDAVISINGQTLSDVTPHILQGAIPTSYTIVFNKKGYFPYETIVDVAPGMVTQIDVTLMPNNKNYEQRTFPYDLFQYFVVRRLMDEKIIVLTDKGVFVYNNEFVVEKRITSLTLSRETSQSINQAKYTGDTLLLWSPKQIWTILIENKVEAEEPPINVAYKAEHVIKHVFWGLKKRYLIVQDGRQVSAIDIKKPSIFYSIATLHTNDGVIFYNEDSDLLFLYEQDANTNKRTVKKINLRNDFFI